MYLDVVQVQSRSAAMQMICFVCTWCVCVCCACASLSSFFVLCCGIFDDDEGFLFGFWFFLFLLGAKKKGGGSLFHGKECFCLFFGESYTDFWFSKNKTKTYLLVYFFLNKPKKSFCFVGISGIFSHTKPFSYHFFFVFVYIKKIIQRKKYYITFNNGYLGSCIDEDRSELW